MIITGIFLKANQARIITLSGSRASHELLAEKFTKLDLPKNPTQDDVEVFVQAFRAHCTSNSIDKVIINRRATNGQGAGGAGTFLLEGVFLATSQAPVEFVHSATIRATDRREPDLKTERPSTVDLGKAYDLAFEGLN
ncbi:hypothetical protein AYI75_16205 [Shewanella algae]|uniref:DUF3010 family protein n=1 Tax=Shewanella algae TaxID=38313 RepID=UPI00119EB818|nr:DUF3010 family protein [Shewanella algae]TWO83233.1 hypothetical protein AYI75_16205 [Shewanella algae]